MSAEGNHVRQKSTVTRIRPLLGANESSEEHAETLMGTLAAVKSHPKKATTARRAESRQFSRTTDHEEEVGRFDSQQFLELVKYGSKSEESIKKANKYLEDFKKAINDQGKDLNSEVNRQEAQSSSRDVEFSGHFRTAYSLILRDNATTQTLEEHLNPNPGGSCHFLHQRSTEVLSGAASLIEQLQQSCSELEAQQASFVVNTDWREDMHKMKRILDFGRQIGEQKMESIFTGIRNPLLDAQRAEIAQLLYNKHNQLASDLTWDGAVRKQEKAVMRLVNTLPWE